MEDRISSLIAWATSHGATLHPQVEIHSDPNTGLSFRVKPSSQTPIPPWEPIVTIPPSLTLSYLNALPSSSSPSSFDPDFLDQSPPHVTGRLLLIRHYLLGTASFYHPYIQCLPQPDQPDTWALPPFWDDDEQELLEGTNLEVGMEKIRADVTREYANLTTLIRQHPDTDNLLSETITRKLYEWAYSIFSSRSFRPNLVLETPDGILPPGCKWDDFSILLPLFDIGNHSMTTPIQWIILPDKQGCQLCVEKEHLPSAQIYNNYSLKTNAELLLGYGFMIPASEDLHNDYIHVRKRTSASSALPEEYYISLRPMTHPSSILGSQRQPLLVNTPDTLRAFTHIPQIMVWDIFTTLTTPSQRSAILPGCMTDAAQQEAFFCGRVDGAEGKLYLEQTIAVVQHKVLQELERLDETDVEVGEGVLQHLSARQRLALEYGAQCRAVLENTLESIGEDDSSAV